MTRWIVGLLCTFVFSVYSPLVRAELIDFDSLNAYTDVTASGSYYNGYGFGAAAGSWSTGGATFPTNEFGPGWSYSNVNNTTDGQFTNQFAAFTGSGVGGGGNYIIGTGYGDEDIAFFTLPENTIVSSVFVTNATYPALTMRDGDPYGFSERFGGQAGTVPDFFVVTFTGYLDESPDFAPTAAIRPTATGSVDFVLADYRFTNSADDYIVDTWQLLDLSPLGAARSVALTFSGSQQNSFGLLTPTYVALDNLSVTAVPEPISLFATAAGVGALIATGRRKTTRRRHRRTRNSINEV